MDDPVLFGSKTLRRQDISAAEGHFGSAVEMSYCRSPAYAAAYSRDAVEKWEGKKFISKP